MTPQEYNGRMILDLCEMGDRILDSYQRQMFGWEHPELAMCQNESYPQGYKCFAEAVVSERESEQALCMKHYRGRQ
jgi:hypothetical protein